MVTTDSNDQDVPGLSPWIYNVAAIKGTANPNTYPNPINATSNWFTSTTTPYPTGSSIAFPQTAYRAPGARRESVPSRLPPKTSPSLCPANSGPTIGAGSKSSTIRSVGSI